MKVVMMRQKSLESNIEKSDQNSVDGMRQEVYSKGKEIMEMHNEMSGQLFLKRKMMMVERGKQKKKNEFQYEVSQQRSNFGCSQVEQ